MSFFTGTNSALAHITNDWVWALYSVQCRTENTSTSYSLHFPAEMRDIKYSNSNCRSTYLFGWFGFDGERTWTWTSHRIWKYDVTPSYGSRNIYVMFTSTYAVRWVWVHFHCWRVLLSEVAYRLPWNAFCMKAVTVFSTFDISNTRAAFTILKTLLRFLSAFGNGNKVENMDCQWIPQEPLLRVESLLQVLVSWLE